MKILVKAPVDAKVTFEIDMPDQDYRLFEDFDFSSKFISSWVRHHFDEVRKAVYPQLGKSIEVKSLYDLDYNNIEFVQVKPWQC